MRKLGRRSLWNRGSSCSCAVAGRFSVLPAGDLVPYHLKTGLVFLSYTCSLGELSMRRVACFLLVGGLTASWIGCATDSEPVQTSQSEPTSSETVLVSLSVPNMT